jgi:hypothetical protein
MEQYGLANINTGVITWWCLSDCKRTLSAGGGSNRYGTVCACVCVRSLKHDDNTATRREHSSLCGVRREWRG